MQNESKIDGNEAFLSVKERFNQAIEAQRYGFIPLSHYVELTNENELLCSLQKIHILNLGVFSECDIYKGDFEGIDPSIMEPYLDLMDEHNRPESSHYPYSADKVFALVSEAPDYAKNLLPIFKDHPALIDPYVLFGETLPKNQEYRVDSPVLTGRRICLSDDPEVVSQHLNEISNLAAEVNHNFDLDRFDPDKNKRPDFWQWMQKELPNRMFTCADGNAQVLLQVVISAGEAGKSVRVSILPTDPSKWFFREYYFDLSFGGLTCSKPLTGSPGEMSGNIGYLLLKPDENGNGIDESALIGAIIYKQDQEVDEIVSNFLLKQTFLKPSIYN